MMTPSNDQLEIVRILLALGLALSNVAVWCGVYLEKDKFSQETKDRGWRILVRGLAAEAALAFMLLAVDTTVGVRQRAEILALEKHAAPRNMTADEIGHLVAALKPLGPFSYDIIAPTELEPGSFLLNQLILTLREAGWTLRSMQGDIAKWQLPPLTAIFALDPAQLTKSGTVTVPTILVGHSIGGVGIRVFFDLKRNPQLGRGASMLSGALNEIGIVAESAVYDTHDNMAADAIHISIGTKP